MKPWKCAFPEMAQRARGSITSFYFEFSHNFSINFSLGGLIKRYFEHFRHCNVRKYNSFGPAAGFSSVFFWNVHPKLHRETHSIISWNNVYCNWKLVSFGHVRGEIEKCEKDYFEIQVCFAAKTKQAVLCDEILNNAGL